MFHPKTVFVLGAGSSCEIGMPSGKQLVKSIVDTAQSLILRTEIDEETRTFFNMLSSNFSKHVDLLRACESIASGAMRAQSIDNFLYTRSEDLALVELGKSFIAYAIFRAEKQSYLFPLTQSEKFNHDNLVRDTWYDSFFHILVSGKIGLEGLFENITIVNFNYDRTLKHYLIRAITDYFGVSVDDALVSLKELKILHPYGNIGRLPGEPDAWDTMAVPYGTLANGLKDMKSLLYTFQEKTRWAADRQEKISQAMSEAKKIIFLGFAYHRQNMELLFDGTLGATDADIYATAFGLDEDNIAHLEHELIQRRCIVAKNTYLRQIKSVDLLQRFAPMLTA